MWKVVLMKLTFSVTLLVVPVISIVSLFAVSDVYAANAVKQNKVVMRADQLAEEISEKPDFTFGTTALMARNTSLYDHQDGTRSDGIDYLVIPSLGTRYGKINAKISYSQNLRDESSSASQWGDIPITFSLLANKWAWAQPYVLTLTPYTSVILPASQNSTVRDQLQTAISVGASFGIVPDGIAPVKDGAWALAIGLSAGQSIHAYSTDINGSVLNKYSSNQTINLAYTYKVISFSVEYINKSRWTYNGNSKNSFEHSEEIGYSINDQFGVALGHSNGGSSLRANGLDSNIALVNENDSIVYLSMSVEF
jgi:hypothetical protein